MSSTEKIDFGRLGPASKSHILIIGGCGGIGSGVVSACGKLNLEVTIMDLPASIKATGREEAIAIDLKDEGSILTAFQQLDQLSKPLHHVVFASGYTSDLIPVRAMSPDILDDVMDGNLRGMILAAREVLQRMDSGSLTFLSTAIGQVGAPGYAPYGIAKSGLNALIRTIASEDAKRGIRCNGIAPGPIMTPFVRGGMGRGASPDPQDDAPTRFDKAAFEQRIPMGRLGEVEDVVGPALFLMSDAARYVTGQVLHVNGGAYMRD